MTDSLLLFTFSPIQPFIIEARRTEDLHASSRILVELAKAAAQSIQEDGGHLIYPATGKSFADDVPNKMVAVVPSDSAKAIAEKAREKLLECWNDFAKVARTEFLAKTVPVDATWEAIWERQTGKDYLWEVYWASVVFPEGKYQETYEKAEKTLAAVKRARPFIQLFKEKDFGEPGLKDTLSGRRQALRTEATDARDYWKAVYEKLNLPSKLRFGERLDAIGVIKRFLPFKTETPPYTGFPSTSSVASAEFIARVEQSQELTDLLKKYRDALNKAVSPRKFYNVSDDSKWPYDGDLLYRETLTKKRFEEDYRIQINADALESPLAKLGEFYNKAGRPSAYYAIIALDGDGMGERVTRCPTESEHQELSRKLTEFAGWVREHTRDFQAFIIYNGGDDVLAMAPLSTAFDFARAMAAEFEKTGGSASCGITIAHHQSPLSVALRQAQRAESQAKKLPQKAGVCITVLKRSGEAQEARTRWDQEKPSPGSRPILQRLVEYMWEDYDLLSSRFAYEVVREASTAAALPVEARQALLKRQVKRHAERAKLRNQLQAEQPLSDEQIQQKMEAWMDDLTDTLHRWSLDLDDQIPPIENGRVKQGQVELGKWLIIARFIAQGGGE